VFLWRDPEIQWIKKDLIIKTGDFNGADKLYPNRMSLEKNV
jgi:hypothetical protein